MIEVSFPAGLTPAEATLREASDTRSAIGSGKSEGEWAIIDQLAPAVADGIEWAPAMQQVGDTRQRLRVLWGFYGDYWLQTLQSTHPNAA